MTPDALKDEINNTLRNWGAWSHGGWPPLSYAVLPTSRDCIAEDDWRDKRNKRDEPDVVSAEAANLAIVNLALNGDTRSYQIIAAWWSHHKPAKQIAKDLHCSLPSVYRYRDEAMDAFWTEYQIELEKNRRKAGFYLTLKKIREKINKIVIVSEC